MNRQLGGHAPVVAVAVAAKVVDEAIGEEGKLQSRVCLQRRHAIAIVSHLGLFIVYTLRVILSVAIVPMQKQYHWTDAEKGIILSSFFAGYLFLQLAGGYLAIHYGPKLVFGLGVLIPSILTALTPPVAWSIPMLVTLRVLTGLGESVTYPSLHCLLGAWSPKSERSQIVGFTWAGAYLGTTFAFPMASSLIGAGAGWESVFYLAAGAGVLWTILWWVVAADSPETDLHITTAERHHILRSLPPAYDGSTPVPWGVIFSSRAVWAVVAGHTAHNWLFYTLLTYLPDYLTYELDFNIKEAGFVAVMPYIGCFLGSVLAGRAADYVIQQHGWPVVTTRRVFQAGFELSAGILLVLAGYTSNVGVAVACVTLSVAFVGAGSAGGYAANILDLSAYFGGLLMGISNTIATIPGIVSPIITGLVVTSDTKSDTTVAEWRAVFWLGLTIAIIGNGLFVLMASGDHLPGLQAPSDSVEGDDGAEDGASGSTAPLVAKDADGSDLS